MCVSLNEFLATLTYNISQTAVNTLRNYQTFGSRRPDQINPVEDPN